MSAQAPHIDLSNEPQYEYLPVQWTVPGLPEDRNAYRSEISRDWWEGATREERDRLLKDQREQLAVSVARTTGVQVDPRKIVVKVYGASSVRPDEEPTP